MQVLYIILLFHLLGVHFSSACLSLPYGRKKAAALPNLTCACQARRRKRGDFPGGPVVKTSPPSAGGVGSISGQTSKIPHALRPTNQDIKQKQCCNRFNKDFKSGLHEKKP